MHFIKNDSISIEEANKQKPLENKRKTGSCVMVYFVLTFPVVRESNKNILV